MFLELIAIGLVLVALWMVWPPLGVGVAGLAIFWLANLGHNEGTKESVDGDDSVPQPLTDSDIRKQ